MRLLVMPATVLWAAVLWAGPAPAPADEMVKDPAIERATTELDKVRVLVDAGVLPRLRLAKAQQEVEDARDAALLRRTLYGADLGENEAGEMVATARRRLERREADLHQAERAVEAGALSRLGLSESLEAVDRARKEYDAAVSRARLIEQIAGMARVEMEAEEAPFQSTPASYYGERFEGDGVLSATDAMRLEVAFAGHFSHPLPVSARGQTAVHRALGFDHRDRIDVALHPDAPEGMWLRHYLESNKIPYFAFRMQVPGKSTAPHIHIGPQSGRLVKGG